MAIKRFYRSEANKTIAGLLGGLGEYLDIDPVFLRVLYLAVTIFTGVVPGIIVYLLAMLVVPAAPRTESEETPAQEA